MNKAMELRLAHLEKLKLKSQPKPINADEDLESNSSLLLRKDSRVIEADAFVKAVGGRSYTPLEELATQTKGVFTVAVVVDRSGVQTAKSGRKFIAVRLSDL
jgi:hypothetical protein